MDMPFEGFIAYLRRQGFIIGVDHHLRLQELLNRLGPGCQPADLKYLLCPLFATNQKQQQQFYRDFDSYFKYLEVKADIIEVKKPVTKVALKTKDIESSQVSVVTRKWPYILVAAVLLLMVAIISYWVYQPTTIDKSSKEKIVDSSRTPSDNAKETSADGGTLKPGTEPKPPKSLSKTGEGKTDSTIGKEMDTSQPVKSKDREILPEKPDASKDFSFQRYWYMFRWVGFFGTFIIFLFIEIYKYNQRKLILKKKRGKRPPYVWPIIVENPEPGIVKNDHFHEAARFLRMRLKSDIRQIDVTKSISRTTEKAGFPSIQYKTLTRPPEYLILIDLPAYRDHHAQLFDSIAKALEKEGLFVARYFYEKDPRVCFKEPDGKRFYLSDLKTRYSDHRLIIFGDGEEFLDPISGVLDKWTNLFQDWRERAILTPEPPKYWSIREVALAHEFIVLPASLEGLAALVDHFKLSLEPDLKTWKKADLQNIGIPAPECNIDELKAYLGEDAFQWLCACAVYPELHWDLTLYLGSLQCMAENLINEENLLHLIRLPWFRTGSIPDELRWALISELEPRKSRVIRTSIIELLEKNPPPKESFAFDTYRLQLVVQRWMISRKNRKQRKEMIDKLRTVSEKEIVQDYILLRFLDSTSKSPISFILPKRLRKVFYKKSVPIFGFKTGIRFVLTIIIATAVFLFLKPPQLDMPQEVRAVEEKAEQFYKNEKGFWEADYGDGIKMVYIPAGTFIMGSNDYDDEEPPHEVYLDGYWMGKTEVTVGQYKAFISASGHQSLPPLVSKYSPEDDHPVVYVLWEDADAYCKWLSRKIGLTFLLPTEAQWERSARGTEKRKYPWGNKEPDETLANFGSKIGRTSPVGSYPQGESPYGLLDMAGNVWEWCRDYYDPGYYKNAPKENPEGPKIGAGLVIPGSRHVLRGGSGSTSTWYLGCANRGVVGPSGRGSGIGFRLCMENELVEPSEVDYSDDGKYKSGIVETQPDFDSRRFIDTDPIVYITKTGKKYHREGCKYLGYSKIRIKLSEAKRKGFTPCPECKPPK
jgi:formylglycine-generating enzyme required for sulfatase activity